MEDVENRKRRMGKGSIGRVKGSPYWYIWYRNDGRTIRESTKTKSKMEAERKLARRITEAADGEPAAPEFARYSYEDARSLLLEVYEEKKLKSLLTRADGEKTICGLVQLDDFFKGRRISKITLDDVSEFKKKRQKSGAGPSIINRSLSCLRRMLVLMHQRKKLRVVPFIEMLPEPEPRQGFLKPARYAELENAMQEDLRPVLFYLYITGCRSGAAKKVDWTQVIFEDGKVAILLRAAQTKNKEPLLLVLPEKLAAVLRSSPIEKRIGPVFKTTNLTKAFRKACVQVGLGKWRDPEDHDEGYEGLLLHDLRRSGVRNMRRAKVPEDTAMKISQHKTRSVFIRYNIVDTDDIHDAIEQTAAYVANPLQTASTDPAK
jgi:integrase